MKTYSKSQVVQVLRDKIGFRSTQGDVARELGFSQAFISEVMRFPDNLSVRVAEALGFEKLPDRYIKKQ